MQINHVLSQWQLVPLPFAQDAVAASQTNQVLYTTDANNSKSLNVYYTMPFAGEIIGVSANVDTAATGGTLTITPNKSGTGVTVPVLAMTTAAYGTAVCARSKTTFAKNAQIGCKITTTAGWTAETMDLQVTVWVLLKIEGI
jgi:hypothetical protein